MSEQAPKVDQDHQDWLNSRSPDISKGRVTDTDKAHVMADASDPYETNAAALRYAGNKALEDISEPAEFGRAVQGVIRKDGLPEHYQGANNGGISLDHIDDIDDLTAEINYQQEQADEQAEFAGRVHDSLKNTKR